MIDRAIQSIRQPEYIGENRCTPCTIVNVAISLILSALLALFAIELAIVFLVLSLATIGLRGYLVPGTPALTTRYFPDRVLRAFEKEDPTGQKPDWETLEKVSDHRKNAVDPERFLTDIDVIEPCDDGEGLCVTATFGEGVRERIHSLRSKRVERKSHADRLDRELLAPLFDVHPDEITFKDRSYPAIKVGIRVRKWPGIAALIADVATHQELAATSDRWTTIPFEQRLNVLEVLRSFHEECPSCDGTLVETSEAVDSCCLSTEVIALSCRDCDQQLLERDTSMTTWPSLEDLSSS